MPDLSGGRLGPSILTASGKTVHPLDLRPGDIDITDIARSLANQCRFLGHLPGHYSVAQHSVLVSRIVNPANALHGLLHDAAEAYLGDVIRPYKHLVHFYLAYGTAPGPGQGAYGLLALQTAETNALAVIYAGLGLVPPDERARGEVEYADRVAYATEDRDLRGRANEDPRVATLEEAVVPLERPAEAEAWFLRRWAELGGEVRPA